MSRCSQCGGPGHNSRTCSTRNGVVKLFGVHLTNGSFIQKSVSMGNFYNHSGAAAPLPDGYHSDGHRHRRPVSRKQANPWTEEEHRQFLLGLKNFGKGSWRYISEYYVPTRTCVQVASHAQKYFMRQSKSTSKKRRLSLFDMIPDPMEKDSPTREDNTKTTTPPSLDLSLKPDFMPFPLQLWPPNASSLKDNENGTSHHQTIIRPVPVFHEEPILEEVISISKLTLEKTGLARIDPPPLSLRLPGDA